MRDNLSQPILLQTVRLALFPTAVALAGLLSEAGAAPLTTLQAPPAAPVDAQVPTDESIPPQALEQFDLPDASLLARALPWEVESREKSWNTLLDTAPEKRQAVRWRVALSLLNDGLGHETIGMLDQMVIEDGGLEQVANYRLARGQALALMGRNKEAIEALAHPLLMQQPDACLWRMRALVAVAKSEQALGEARCAVTTLNHMDETARLPFLRALARAGVEAGKPEFALDWLVHLPDDDPEGLLLRAQAQIAAGKAKDGYTTLAAAARTSIEALAAEAELVRIRDGIKTGAMEPDMALASLEQLTFRWRGGAIEKEALQLTNKLAATRGDMVRMLATGATLIRYFSITAGDSEFLATYRANLSRLLDPETSTALPVEAAAGLYWEYRDLAPVGAQGDLLASQLAGRLETAGLESRAAELLEHLMLARVADEAKGPLSIKVATLYLKSNAPNRALEALRRTARLVYPPDILNARKKIEAVALTRVRRGEEALALLEGVPEVAGLTAEILWRMEDWQRLAAAQAPMIVSRKKGPLAADGQVLLLRQAIALSMVGDDVALGNLREIYGSSFSGQPADAAFKLLTSPSGAAEPETLVRAMGAMPAASPAGPLADLMGSASLTATSQSSVGKSSVQRNRPSTARVAERSQVLGNQVQLKNRQTT